MLYLYPYDRRRAVEYARLWALDRNPEYDDFAGVGGDCTNFVSQAVFAGSCQMNYTETFGWYFRSLSDRAPAWTGVEEFFGFMTGSGDYPDAATREGPVGAPCDRDYAEAGDVVQLANDAGDFYHTLIITDIDDDGEIYVSAHTVDALDRPLSSYKNAFERFIKIVGVASENGELKCGE